MTTNIGEYDIEVVGTGAFPLFKIDRGIVDFGVCALNRTYSSDFTVSALLIIKARVSKWY